MSLGRLAPLDAAVVGAYLLGMLALAVLLARRQRTGTDYFLAGRRLGAWPLALSIVANQASAISLVGAPAFVALRPGGGLRWLQYELALPLAMALLIALILPVLRRLPAASIYAYAELRFGRGTRRALAGAFVLSRGLSLGVILYASALVVAEALGWTLVASLLAVGLAAIAYTSVGGLAADVWTDVVQLVLLWSGTLAAAGYVFWHTGPGLIAAVPRERVDPLVLAATGLGDGQTFALLPMLCGGFFLYVSYYGCDQSQAQRLLAARDDGAARRALLLNGLLRFPLVLSYCGLGLLLAGLLRVDPAFAGLLEGRPHDSLVPIFMMSYLPDGLRGLFLAAILAAAMSSVDSALNSLAAVTLEDVLGRDPERTSAWLGRGLSLAWGAFAVISGLAFARSGAGVIELVNQVGSAFYGPVLAVFALGVLAPRVGGREAVAGLAAGFLANLLLARLAPGVSWLWWNPAGAATAGAVALTLAATRTPALARQLAPASQTPAPIREIALLVGAFLLMLASLAAVSAFAGRA
ncbi:MAG: sodium/solute symporter [Vicinamibacteria bacterium]